MADPLTNARFAQQLFDPALQAFTRANAGRLALAEREADQRERAARLLAEQNFTREIEAGRGERDMARLAFSERQADRRTEAQVKRDEEREIRRLRAAIQQAYSRAKLPVKLSELGDINANTPEELNALLETVSAAAAEQEVQSAARTMLTLSDRADGIQQDIESRLVAAERQAREDATARSVAASGNKKFIRAFNDATSKGMSGQTALRNLARAHPDAVAMVQADVEAEVVAAVDAIANSDSIKALAQQARSVRQAAINMEQRNPLAADTAARMLVERNVRGDAPAGRGKTRQASGEWHPPMATDETSLRELGRISGERMGSTVLATPQAADSQPAAPVGPPAEPRTPLLERMRPASSPEANAARREAILRFATEGIPDALRSARDTFVMAPAAGIASLSPSYTPADQRPSGRGSNLMGFTVDPERRLGALAFRQSMLRPGSTRRTELEKELAQRASQRDRRLLFP
jgi:hypothetical protein